LIGIAPILAAVATLGAPPPPAAPPRAPAPPPTIVATDDAIELGPDLKPLHVLDGEILARFKVDAGVETFLVSRLGAAAGKETVMRLGAQKGCTALFAAAQEAFAGDRRAYYAMFVRTVRAVVPEPALKSVRNPFFGQESLTLASYLPKLQAAVNREEAPLLARMIETGRARLAARLSASPEPDAETRTRHAGEYEGLRTAGGCPRPPSR
jgi:hypothetical protein